MSQVRKSVFTLGWKESRCAWNSPFVLLCPKFFHCHLSLFHTHIPLGKPCFFSPSQLCTLGSHRTICLPSSCTSEKCWWNEKLQSAEWMPPRNSGYTWSIYVHFAADARAESFSEVWRSWSSSSALNYGDLNKANHPLKFETYWNMSVCQKWVRQTKDKDVQSKAIHPLFCALFKTNRWGFFFLSIFDNLSVIKLLKLSFKQWIWICRCYFDMPDVVFRKSIRFIPLTFMPFQKKTKKKTWKVIGRKSQKGPIRFLHWQLSQ